MNDRRMLTILAAAFLLADCAGAEPGASARRYLDMFEIDRYGAHADPNASLITTRFRLLDRPEVRADLRLSEEQMVAVQTIYKTPWKDIPGFSNFIAQQKKAKQGLSEEERTSHNRESSRRISRLTADFHGQQLNEILTVPQRDRLDQFVRQVHGPVLILVQTNLKSVLVISPEQMKRITAAVHEADREIIPALQKFGRGFISGYGPGENEQTREREMNDLITRLRRMIAERDNEILSALTDDQRKAWIDLQGKSLQIEWSPWDLIKGPFEK